MNKALITSKLDGLKKRDLTKLAKDVANNFDGSPLRELAWVKRMEHLLASYRKELEPLTEQEIAMYKGRVEMDNTEFTFVENSSPQLDYRQDMRYQELEDSLKYRKMLLDNSFKTEKDYVDPHTGEMVPKVQVKGYRKSYVKAEF
jgi:hypothetical protein